MTNTPRRYTNEHKLTIRITNGRLHLHCPCGRTIPTRRRRDPYQLHVTDLLGILRAAHWGRHDEPQPQ